MKFKKVKFTKVKPPHLVPRYEHPVDWHELIGFVDEWDVYVAPLREPVVFVNNGLDYYVCYFHEPEHEKFMQCFKESKYGQK